MSELTGRHKLKRPLKIVVKTADGEEEQFIGDVVMRPVERAGDLLCTDKYQGAVAKSFALVAHLSGLTYAQVCDLHPDDLDALTEEVNRFL